MVMNLGATGGPGLAGSQPGGGGGGGGEGGGGGGGNSPTNSPIYEDPIVPPDMTLAERVAANYAALAPLFSPLSDSFGGSGGTQTVTIPERPTATNWTPYLILAAIVGGFYYWYKHRKKEG
jgi:hypothetical protein